ncbi:MAG: bifunctional glutamate N-acetyltransferase/amino-acid acetyltransferase ArgJ [Pseudomonadota bacterium]
MPAVPGVALASAEAGVRYHGRPDVMLAVFEAGTVMAGTFTRSATRSAPVIWCEERLKSQTGPSPTPLALVVNAGNANAFTGKNGLGAVKRVADATAAALSIPAEAVYLASTGVIGEPLPAGKIADKLVELGNARTGQAWEGAARAIMTTDTYPKAAAAVVDIAGVPVTIAGIAKGSGMIAPDMATMLAFVFTDCAITPGALQPAVSSIADITFNAITVDGDTSTSDTLLVAATGKAPMAPIASRREPRWRAFAAGLETVMRDLAIQVVKDGEGASKFVSITVSGAKSSQSARKIGLAVANSPLVKTALAGEDPNWGRIVMAVGKSGEAADRDRLRISFGDILVAEHGWVAPAYREADGAAYMRRSEIEIAIDVGIGRGRATVWTCDLTKRYVEINADYRS